MLRRILHYPKYGSQQYEIIGNIGLVLENTELERQDLEPLDAFKDRGLVLSPELKHHIQVDAAVKKARNAAFPISRVFRQLPRKVFLRAYTAAASARILHTGLILNDARGHG